MLEIFHYNMQGAITGSMIWSPLPMNGSKDKKQKFGGEKRGPNLLATPDSPLVQERTFLLIHLNPTASPLFPKIETLYSRSYQ